VHAEPAIATRRRVPLRILVRAPGVAVSELATSFEGYKVVILGFAKTEDWDGLWQDGDLEGFVWVSASVHINDAIEDLRSFWEIVDARISPRDVK
jgi:hypothetical protein